MKDNAKNGTVNGVAVSSIPIVVIHVIDEYRQSSKIFKCQRELLLTEMKYFQAYLSGANEHDEIEISVHCDVKIFALLIKYMRNRGRGLKPHITLKNIVSILVASEFLQMEELVQECVSYISSCMQDFINHRVSLSGLLDSTITKIAESCTIEQLQLLYDPQDKILSKLQQKKVEAIVSDLQTRERHLELCMYCGLLFLKDDRNGAGCFESKFYIGVHGELIGHHEAKAGWQVETFLQEVKADNNISWIAVFWYILGSIEYYRCTGCKRECSLRELQDCAYHPGDIIDDRPVYKYSCCGVPIFSADENLIRGCQTTTHTMIHCDRRPIVNSFLNSMSLPNMWAQISACESMARMQGSAWTSDVKGGSRIDASSLFHLPHPRKSLANTAICNLSSKNCFNESKSDIKGYRRQCEVLQLQEKDCVHFFNITHQLLNQRKKATN
ncbi:Protein of unknown function DUF3342 [Plasmopara halstedii]|uniref:SANT and BTB domain-containing protein n=1 Tax=Plasmopara halstedii TaxID=4781 RepID=A0A0P1A5M9_PLAHL|nr:Protein of unknown function DUF3342 [Plasmopara halstedii]CEG35424.1 Protein of unknown function DUF3342 [Plasmopara halstedii]|eukprot:XP_024571793.1 Protein of unknown function DUF3342 [Plasmopara halstedii]